MHMQHPQLETSRLAKGDIKVFLLQLAVQLQRLQAQILECKALNPESQTTRKCPI